jgi:hypothetical protein
MPFSKKTLSPQLVDSLVRLERTKNIKARSDDPLFEEVFRAVNYVLGGRNWEYKMYTDFFEGGDAQKTYFTRFDRETTDEYYRRLDQSVVVNKSRGIVMKGARSLYAIAQPERRMEDEAAHERIQMTWKFNTIYTGMFHMDVAIEAGKYGFSVVQNVYVDKKTGQPVFFRPGPTGRENYDVQYIQQLSPLMIPIARADKKTEMGKLIRLTMKGDDNFLNIGQDQNKDIGYIELITDTDWLMWRVDFNRRMFGSDVLVAERIPLFFGPGYLDRNPYGDVNVPFTLYRAANDSRMKIWGESDLSDIIEPQTQYNQTLSDDGHVIAQNTFPILFGKGMSLPDEWRRGPNDTVAVNNVQANLEYVTWDANLEASASHEDRMERAIRESGGYSPVSDGDLRNIGQVRNLRGAMMPELMSVNHKQISFADAEVAHAIATLSMIEFHEDTEYPEKQLDIEFSEDFVPVDELTEAETTAINLSTGVDNLRDLIRRRNPELDTEEEVDRKLKETLELIKELAEAKAGPQPDPATEDPGDGRTPGQVRNERSQTVDKDK